MSVIDQDRVRARDPGGCSNSHFQLWRTTCCNSYAVHDDELSNLYLSPDDLTNVFSLLGAPDDPPMLCPFCGVSDWDLTELSDPSDVPPSWTWAAVATEPPN